MQRRRAVLALVVVLGALLALWVVSSGTSSGQASANPSERGCGLAPVPPRPVSSTSPQPPARVPVGQVAEAMATAPSASPAPVPEPSKAAEPPWPPPIAVTSTPDVHWVTGPPTMGAVVAVDYDPSGQVLLRDAAGQVFRGPREGPWEALATGLRAAEVVSGPLLLAAGEIVVPTKGAMAFAGPWVAPFGAVARHPDGRLAVRSDDVTASRLLVGEAQEQSPMEAVAVVPRTLRELVWGVDGTQVAGLDASELVVIDMATGELERHGSVAARPVATAEGWWGLRGEWLGPPEGARWEGVIAPANGRIGVTDDGTWLAMPLSGGGLGVGAVDATWRHEVVVGGAVTAVDVFVRGERVEAIVASTGGEGDRIGWLDVSRAKPDNGDQQRKETR